jgi:hypothetical protein
MSVIEHEFLRRYATSPMHVPRLERLLDAYGGPDAMHAFAEAFIDWDRACGDDDAARIVSEAISTLVDERGRLIRLTPEAVRGAITWIATSSGDLRTERVQALSTILTEISHVERPREAWGSARAAEQTGTDHGADRGADAGCAD